MSFWNDTARTIPKATGVIETENGNIAEKLSKTRTRQGLLRLCGR